MRHPDDPIQDDDDFLPEKSLLEYKKEKEPFLKYLEDKFFEDYHGVKDDFESDFERWLDKQDIDSLIDYGNEFAKKLLIYLGNK